MENFILGLECCKPFWSNGDVSQQSIFSFSFVFSATWTFLRCSIGCAFRLVCPSLNSHGFLGVWARLRRWTRSPGKKIWCCKHHHVGCHGPSRKWLGGSLAGFIRWQLGRNGRNMGWLAMWYAGAVFGARTNHCFYLFIENPQEIYQEMGNWRDRLPQNPWEEVPDMTARRFPIFHGNVSRHGQSYWVLRNFNLRISWHHNKTIDCSKHATHVCINVGFFAANGIVTCPQIWGPSLSNMFKDRAQPYLLVEVTALQLIRCWMSLCDGCLPVCLARTNSLPKPTFERLSSILSFSDGNPNVQVSCYSTEFFMIMYCFCPPIGCQLKATFTLGDVLVLGV